jgi:hypothetical protein
MPVTGTTTPLQGFRIAMADANGNKTSQETLLHPAPTRVEYPTSELGEVVETADGRVVVQVSSRDPRRRTWAWVNFGPEVVTYERQQRWLQQLTARTRLAQGLPPHIYVYDGTTGLLNLNRSLETTASASGTIVTVPSLASVVSPDALKNAVLEVLPATTGGSNFPYERRTILAATATTLTLADPLSGALGTSKIVIQWSQPAWWKARVIDTTRELRGDGGTVRYSATKFTFVIDEEMPS